MMYCAIGFAAAASNVEHRSSHRYEREKPVQPFAFRQRLGACGVEFVCVAFVEVGDVSLVLVHFTKYNMGLGLVVFAQ